MNDLYFYKSDLYLLNHCSKYLVRFNSDRRNTYGNDPQARDNDAEAWRFPVIDTYAGGISKLNDATVWNQYNEVTFISFVAMSQRP